MRESQKRDKRKDKGKERMGKSGKKRGKGLISILIINNKLANAFIGEKL